MWGGRPWPQATAGWGAEAGNYADDDQAGAGSGSVLTISPDSRKSRRGM